MNNPFGWDYPAGVTGKDIDRAMGGNIGEETCPDCNGAGFFGGNGPVVHSICVACHGTGSIPVDARYKPDDRMWRSIFSDMQERRGRDGY